MAGLIIPVVGLGASLAILRKLKNKNNGGVILEFDKLPKVVKEMINKNDRELPRLPIPPLEQTIKQYLASVKPLCATPAEYAEQEKLCEEFKNGVGPELHAWVVANDKAGGYPFSFIEPLWDDMYFGLRCPAPVSISPFFALTDEKLPSDQSQLTRAAKFINGFTLWSRMVLAGKLEPDKNLCSQAYPKHFSSAKIPKKGKDALAMFPNSRHITVLCKGQVFTVEVVSASGSILDVAGIAIKLSEVIKVAQKEGTGTLALLTSEDRDVWANARSALEAEGDNKAKLNAIDAGIICVCLDDESSGDLKKRALRLLVGPGENRWWDKQQLVVDGSGFMGIAFEHSYGDGTNWGRFIKDVMSHAEGKDSLPTLPTHGASSAPAPTLIKLSMPTSVISSVATAKANYTKLTADIDLEVLDFTKFGKAEIKTWNCSPDAVLQLAFMAAYYQLHSKMPPVYEACATRGFFHGRTETIRSCTEAAAAFCKSLAAKGPKEETLALMQAAAKQHSAISKLAAGGSGIDRHLTAMANSAPAKASDVALFNDAKFKESKDWALSTSNGSGPYLAMFGFAAVTTHGYGNGYLIEDNKVNVVISCFHSCAMTSSKNMKDAISATLESMQGLVKK